MEEAFNVYFIGTAGCGKSTLTAAFHEWLNTQGYDSILVNLDPGAESVAFEPHVDIRDWLKLSDIMREYGLGPNGAQIVAADLLAINAPEVKKQIDEFETDYILIDTPGQLELFTFRESSRRIIELMGETRSTIAFLMDPILCKKPNGYVSSQMLATTTSFRLMIPLLPLISKSDLLTEEESESISNWSTDIYSLQNALGEDVTTAQNQISIEFLRALENVGFTRDIKFVSSETMMGLEDIYNFVQQISTGGEDLVSR